MANDIMECRSKNDGLNNNSPVMKVNMENKDLNLALAIAQKVAEQGGRAMFVGGYVRDRLSGAESKDIDIEVYGLAPSALKAILEAFGPVVEKGASFGVYGIAHTQLDIAMPRRERCVGLEHRSFEVNVDPDMDFKTASMRRDFTINAMMMDGLTGEIVDCWGGREDLKNGVIRHVSDQTFPEDALRVFRCAQFAARLKAEVAPETLELCRGMDVTHLACERVFEEVSKALLKAEKPSVFFRVLRAAGHLGEFFPELEACIGVEQSPVYHPEGDVFEHTMLVLDCAAQLRSRAQWPLAFMLSALFHDLGKVVATEVQADGRITAYGHEVQGLDIVQRQMQRLTRQTRLIEYVKNQMWLHMRPNLLAQCHSRKKKTRQLFDMSVCPEDLILLSRADASGKLDAPYNEANECFLMERLADYRKVLAQPMVSGEDLIKGGFLPGPDFSKWIERARQLRFAGLDRSRALAQVVAEARKGLENPASEDKNE